ncbi:ribonuclease P protein component [Brevibacillus marinus]|uniref:ribonuclease P protein component n=1 Tax=Brevibacillus marinus TaxID=2496837 RepID=UPI000F83C77D|nr:ribonuclease P protein component [Brevibacillus marinus]
MHRSHRLRKNEEFQIVFQQGTSSANRQFVVYALRKEEQAVFRVGISVSKKIGNAVTRNRVKRYIREAILSLEQQIDDAYDLVVIARQGTEELSLDELRSSLLHVLKRANVLKRGSLPKDKKVERDA